MEEGFSWKEALQCWRDSAEKFPRLQRGCVREVFPAERRSGSFFYYDWLIEGKEDEWIRDPVAAFEKRTGIGCRWSGAARKTVELLYQSADLEMQAAVWIAGFMRSILRKETGSPRTLQTAQKLENLSAAKLPANAIWHSESRVFFPRFYCPKALYFEKTDYSAFSLIDFAATNAALVLGQFVPVVFNMGGKSFRPIRDEAHLKTVLQNLSKNPDRSGKNSGI